MRLFSLMMKRQTTSRVLSFTGMSESFGVSRGPTTDGEVVAMDVEGVTSERAPNFGDCIGDANAEFGVDLDADGE